MNLQTQQLALVSVLAITIGICVRDAADTMPQLPKVAIFADYDACWDILVPPRGLYIRFRPEELGEVEAWKDTAEGFLKRAIDNITAGREVTLFVGSNRQSQGLDATRTTDYKNGRALGQGGAFEQLAEKLHFKLNKALLSDGLEPFSGWNNSEALDPWGKGEADRDLKVRIVRNNFKQLNGTGNVSVFFFDDMSEFLDYVREKVRVELENNTIKFYTVHYDWFEYLNNVRYGRARANQPLVAQDVEGRTWSLCRGWPECSKVV